MPKLLLRMYIKDAETSEKIRGRNEAFDLPLKRRRCDRTEKSDEGTGEETESTSQSQKLGAPQ